MKILVTGGAGFIGSHTVDALLGRGYDVRILDSLESPVHPDREKPDYVPPEAEFILGDVRNSSDMEKALRGVEAVFHLAAHQGYLTDFSTFASVNDAGTALLYETIVRAGLPVRKVIIASSQAVYGEGKYECAEHGVQYPPDRSRLDLLAGRWDVLCPKCRRAMSPLKTDESSVRPHNQYAISKYAQELYSLTLGRRFDIPTVALRYSITQGARQSPSNAYSGVLRILSTKLMTGQSPTIYEDGNQLRDYVHVDDVVAANLLALESNQAEYRVFNVGGDRAVSVNYFADLVIEAMGAKVRAECPGEFRFGDVRHVISDVDELRKLGWAPRKDLAQNIADYLGWAVTRRMKAEYCGSAEAVMRRLGVLQRAA